MREGKAPANLPKAAAALIPRVEKVHTFFCFRAISRHMC